MQLGSNYFFDYEQSGKYQPCSTVTKNPFGQGHDLQPQPEVLMDTSFESNLAEDHALAIWKASVQFLNNSLKLKCNQNLGFNDQSVFDLQGEDRDEDRSEKSHVLEMISRNAILGQEDKNQLREGVKKSKDLAGLLERLSSMFCGPVFQELLVIFHEALQKYQLFKETTRLSAELSKLLSPSYTQFNEDLDQIENKQAKTYYIQQSEAEIASKADQAAQAISAMYLTSSKIRYLNLKEADTVSSRSNMIRKQFQGFLEIICKAVFLCAEGCFFHPNGQNCMPLTVVAGSEPFLNMSNKSLEEDSHGRKRRNS